MNLDTIKGPRRLSQSPNFLGTQNFIQHSKHPSIWSSTSICIKRVTGNMQPTSWGQWGHYRSWSERKDVWKKELWLYRSLTILFETSSLCSQIHMNHALDTNGVRSDNKFNKGIREQKGIDNNVLQISKPYATMMSYRTLRLARAESKKNSRFD